MVAIFSISRYILAHALPHSAGGHGDWQRPRRRTIYICDIILCSSSRSHRRPGILQRQRRRRQRSHAICHHEPHDRVVLRCLAVSAAARRSKRDSTSRENRKWILLRNGTGRVKERHVLGFFSFFQFPILGARKRVDTIMFGTL